MTRPNILAPKEAAIMARWDGGQSIEAIARAMRISRAYASTVVNRYAEDDEGRRWRTNAAAGSAKLLRAITSQRAAA